MAMDSKKGHGSGQQKKDYSRLSKEGGELLQALCKLHFNYFTTIKTQNTFQLYVLKKIHKLYKVSIKYYKVKKEN